MYALNTHTGTVHYVWRQSRRNRFGRFTDVGLCPTVWYGYGSDPKFLWDEYPENWELSAAMPKHAKRPCKSCAKRLLRGYQ